MVENPLYTIKLSFNASGDRAKKILSTAWLFKLACHRVLSRSKELLNALIPSKIAWVKMFYSDARDLIPNKRYAYGGIYLVYGIWEGTRELGIDYRSIELSEWLMFQHYDREVDGNVIRILEDGSALVTTYSYDGSKDRVLIKSKPNRGHGELLKLVVESKEKYMPRVVVRGYNVRSGKLYVSGEIHVTIGYDFYLKHATRYGEPRGSLIGVQLPVVIASFLFPCIPLGFSSGLGAFGATPETPHLELLPLGRAIYGSSPLTGNLIKMCNSVKPYKPL